MQYTSTRDSSVRFTASQAITQGLSADGGLLTPYYIPKLPGNALDELKDMPYQARAVYVMKQFLEEFTVKELTDFAAAAYGPEKFDTPAVAPVHTLNEGTHCLELWHGPTCAFKDMALQMLPHLLTASLTKTEEFRTGVLSQGRRVRRAGAADGHPGGRQRGRGLRGGQLRRRPDRREAPVL